MTIRSKRDKATDLGGQLVVITGGALGAGRVIAEAMGKANGFPVIIDYDLDTAFEATRRLADQGIISHAYDADLTDETDTREVMAAIEDNFGPIGAMIHTVGLGVRLPDGAYAGAPPDKAVDLSRESLLYAMNASAAVWISRKQTGRIINIGVFEEASGQFSATVAETEAMIADLTRDAAEKWSPYAIGVNAIACGGKADLSAVASAAVFLASRAASHVTGQVLVDGGWTIA